MRAARRASLRLLRRTPLPAVPCSAAVTLARRSRILSLSASCWAWRVTTVSTSGARSCVVYLTLGASARACAAMRKPRATSAPNRATCHDGTERMREPSDVMVSVPRRPFGRGGDERTPSRPPRQGQPARPREGPGRPGTASRRSPPAAPAPGAGEAPAPPDALGSVDDPGAAVLPPGGALAATSQPGGSGPAGAGCGPCSVGGSAPSSASHAASKPARSVPTAAVNASSSVTPSAYPLTRLTRASDPFVSTRKLTAETLSA